MAKKSFHEWTRAANDYCRRYLGFRPLGPSDDYVLAELSVARHREGLTPKEFIREVFADDFEARNFERHLGELADR